MALGLPSTCSTPAAGPAPANPAEVSWGLGGGSHPGQSYASVTLAGLIPVSPHRDPGVSLRVCTVSSRHQPHHCPGLHLRRPTWLLLRPRPR